MTGKLVTKKSEKKSGYHSTKGQKTWRYLYPKTYISISVEEGFNNQVDWMTCSLDTSQPFSELPYHGPVS